MAGCLLEPRLVMIVLQSENLAQTKAMPQALHDGNFPHTDNEAKASGLATQ